MPVLSCNHVTYYSNTTSYSCKLENQCALVKFTTASTTAPVHVGGLYTGAMIDFDNNSITNNGTTGFVALNSKSATEKWAVLLPQTGFEDAEAAIAHVGYTTTIPAIAADGFITGDAAISISTLSNIVYLDWLTGNYTATNGKILTGTLSGNYKISVENKVGGATVTLRNATIKYTNTTINTNWAGLSCLGDATIMLEGTNIVESGKTGSNIADYPGIHIAASHTLTIDGSGELTASSCRQTNFSRGAGIGGGYNEACGDIVIKGGIIHALGGKYDAAGIGSAGNYNNNAACGNITIEGGEVEAIAYGVAAGIGCGIMNHCGNILIKNGAVTAQGGEGSAGIGAAYSANNSSGASNSQCGTITIEGGTVTATGGQFGAGIGSGTSRGNYSHSICGTITIEGGTVTATGGEGGMVDSNVFYGAAGIGTGSSILGGYNGYSDCGDITITSGVTSVTATKGGGTYPAENSIGKNHSNGSGTCGTITIGGTVYPNGADANQADGLTFIYPMVTTITWDQTTVGSICINVNENYEYTDGIITIEPSTNNAIWSGNSIQLYDTEDNLTFSTSTGNITKIEITFDEMEYDVGIPSSNWTCTDHKLIWTGFSSSVELGCMASAKGVPDPGDPGVGPGGGGAVTIEPIFQLTFVTKVEFTVRQ